MSDDAHRAEIPECGSDVAAYALGALDAAELEAFRMHLAGCVVCQEELTGFEHVVDALPISTPQHRASDRLRDRIMDEVAGESGPAPAARRRRGLPRFSMSRTAVALGTAVVVLAIAVVVVSSRPAGTHVYAARVAGAGTAEVSVTGDRAELIVHHLSPPPEGQIYEVWLQKPGRAPAPTRALFSTTSSGEGDVDVPGTVRGVAALMVTAEPAGGTRVPTNPPVISARLS